MGDRNPLINAAPLNPMINTPDAKTQEEVATIKATATGRSRMVRACPKLQHTHTDTD